MTYIYIYAIDYIINDMFENGWLIVQYKLHCAINNLLTIHFHPKLDKTACESRVIRAF